MAIYWSRDVKLTTDIAYEEIGKIANFEKELFGFFNDTSIYDTIKIMEKYFSFTKYVLKENITKADIIQSLNNDNVVIVPVYGRDLKNKNYTPPGAIPHMLVII